MKFHRISRVKALDNFVLIIEFINGEKKKYDIKPLFERWEVFKQLKDIDLFNAVKVDAQGYGLAWNDEIDLSCNELWENGKIDNSPVIEKI
jgi:hypothetical protein